ncbi:hypothetical protein N2152v2_008559 [Parachlorella kessleri]
MTWRQDDQVDRQRYERCSSAPNENPAAKACPDSGASNESLYSMLGASPDASASQLRKAWLQLLVTAHPDKGGCPDRFMALQRAYAVLSDAAQRAAYDDKLSREGGSSCAALEAAYGAYGGGGNSRGRVVRSSRGVTVVVHGQMGPDGTAPRPRSRTTPTAAAVSGDEEISKLTAMLEALQQHTQQGQQPSNSSGIAASQELAELYLRRAEALWQARRLHHAAFDAQEALQLRPGWEPAQQLLAQLEATARAAADVEAPAGSGLEDSSSEEGEW